MTNEILAEKQEVLDLAASEIAYAKAYYAVNRAQDNVIKPILENAYRRLSHFFPVKDKMGKFLPTDNVPLENLVEILKELSQAFYPKPAFFDEIDDEIASYYQAIESNSSYTLQTTVSFPTGNDCQLDLMQAEYQLAYIYLQKSKNDACYEEAAQQFFLQCLNNAEKIEKSSSFDDTHKKLLGNIYLLAAEVALKNNHHEKAVKYNHDALKVGADNVDYFVKLAKSFFAENKSEEAEECLKLFDAKKIEQTFSSENVRNQSSLLDLYIFAAKNFFKNKNYDKAIEYNKSALEISLQLRRTVEESKYVDNKISFLYQHLAKIFCTINKFEEAEKCLENIRKIKETPELHEFFAKLFSESGQYTKALKCLHTARALKLQEKAYEGYPGYYALKSQKIAAEQKTAFSSYAHSRSNWYETKITTLNKEIAETEYFARQEKGYQNIFPEKMQETPSFVKASIQRNMDELLYLSLFAGQRSQFVQLLAPLLPASILLSIFVGLSTGSVHGFFSKITRNTLELSTQKELLPKYLHHFATLSRNDSSTAQNIIDHIISRYEELRSQANSDSSGELFQLLKNKNISTQKKCQYIDSYMLACFDTNDSEDYALKNNGKKLFMITFEKLEKQYKESHRERVEDVKKPPQTQTPLEANHHSPTENRTVRYF